MEATEAPLLSSNEFFFIVILLSKDMLVPVHVDKLEYFRIWTLSDFESSVSCNARPVSNSTLKNAIICCLLSRNYLSFVSRLFTKTMVFLN